jgi:hypothetical protein
MRRYPKIPEDEIDDALAVFEATINRLIRTYEK